jgi:hypothetical protein
MEHHPDIKSEKEVFLKQLAEQERQRHGHTTHDSASHPTNNNNNNNNAAK